MKNRTQNVYFLFTTTDVPAVCTNVLSSFIYKHEYVYMYACVRARVCACMHAYVCMYVSYCNAFSACFVCFHMF